jgi:secreted PhoX family phosphatase
MTEALSRRRFLSRSAATGVGIAIAGTIEGIAGPRGAAATSGLSSTGLGELVPDPDGILALPEGFSYKVVAHSGQTSTLDGPFPSDPDAIGVFGHGSGSTLVTNHEVGGSEPYGVPVLADITYDAGARGGTSTLEVNAEGELVVGYTSLAGTHNNCAGGITPWGTWLTCEETEAKAGSGTLEKNHGYVFEVDPQSQSANSDKSPVPLRMLGRFAHEAVAVDPDSFTIYETEDAGGPNGLYYRWSPPAGFVGGVGALRELAQSSGGDTAGTLQAMSCYRGTRHVPDLSLATQPGTRYRVRWVDVPDRDGISGGSVRKQFADDQVTRSRKLEGAWWADGGAYFVASFARNSDGSVNEHDGQVWFYDPATETVTLKTIFGVNLDPDVDADNYDGPDNITVSPYGGIILAEDGEGIQHLIGVTDQGGAYPLARNDYGDGGDEFCGPAFSADGRWLFANIQGPGFLLAITGPWERLNGAR